MEVFSEQDAAPAQAGAESARTARFHRYSRHVMDIALLLVIPLLVAPTLNAARTLFVDPDIWWHLADARLIAATHHMIWTDPYSFTAVGQRWIDWEWLSEQFYWLSYNLFSLRGIYLLTWLGLCGNILFVYWRGYKLARNANAALVAAIVGFLLMTVNSGPRMIAFAYMAMSAELLILEEAERGRKHFIWLLPPLFALWINLHGTWLFGIGLLGLYILCGLFSLKAGAFEQTAFTPGWRNRLLAVFALSCLALLANPYGWHLLVNPFDMMLHQKLSVATIAEWQPLTFSSFEGKGAIVAVVLMVVANLVAGRRKWKAYELALIFFAWYMAIDHHRFTYLAAVLTTPMLALDLKRAFFNEGELKTIPAMNFAMAGAAVVAAIVLFPSKASLEEMVGKMFPQQSIARIEPGWRTYNFDYVGGMMAFEHKSSFMDSRFDSFEHLGVMADSQSIIAGVNALPLLEKYHVDHALLKDEQPIDALLEKTPGWRVVMREPAWQGNYVLLERLPGAAQK
ncbi:MAG: hypothetical protein WBF42_11620 [Terracidiphilus sp.]